MPKSSKKETKEVIRFKEYHKLVDLKLEDSAKQINHLLDPVVAKEDGDRLLKYSLKDFQEFSKNHYFGVDGSCGVNYDGFLSVDWHLTGRTFVNLVFLGKDRVKVCAVSDTISFFKIAKVKSINQILFKKKVPFR